DMIPVVPAAHYSCGGILVDKWGCTTIANLYALGECASTGFARSKPPCIKLFIGILGVLSSRLHPRQ
ncbi:MAG: FAD-binding protein, partial [Bacteroidales bacterium]|nr:FAD-binding protein [Bacteroidales bacterium]